MQLFLTYELGSVLDWLLKKQQDTHMKKKIIQLDYKEKYINTSKQQNITNVLDLGLGLE